jgi:epoxyqueuosine reductase
VTSPQFLTQSLVAELGSEAGFALAGIAAVPAPGSAEDKEERHRFEDWIAAGRAGEMDYLKRCADSGTLLRSSVRIAFPWVKSVIVCVTNYDSPHSRSIDPAPLGTGWIARYAWSGSSSAKTSGSSSSGQPGDAQTIRPSDYHKVLLARLQQLDQSLKANLGPFESRCYVDTGPLVERVYANYAGVGWIGKNTCLLNQQLGSWLFLGVILTSLELTPDQQLQLAPDRCGSCTRCIDACPTQALTPYRMDATRCISYLTIEKRGEIPEELRDGIGRQIFGCDICQDVCPWNAKAHRSQASFASDPDLQPREALINPALDWLAAMDQAEFGRWFFGSPVKRAKFEGFRRNLAIAMGNSRLPRFLPILKIWANSETPAIAEAAAWAIRKLQTSPTAGEPPPSHPETRTASSS